jgi:hypothetical protein
LRKNGDNWSTAAASDSIGLRFAAHILVRETTKRGEMVNSGYRLTIMCGFLFWAVVGGCHRSGNRSESDGTDPAQQEFVQAFLTAHDQKDLDAQEKLVDWDDVTDNAREHFIREYIKANEDVKISSATIESIPGLSPKFSVQYNIPPQKFLVVVYEGSRGGKPIKFPIGMKDGRYYFAMDGLTREAFQRNARQLKK